MVDKKIYLDSCIWYSRFSYNKDTKNKEKIIAKNTIDEILDHNDKIIISYLVLLETIDVLRKKYIRAQQSKNLCSEFKKQVENILESRFIQMLDIITEMEINNDVKIIDSRRKVYDINSEIYVLTKLNFGDIIKSPDPNYSEFCDYEGMHHLDYHHSLFAMECGADEIITFDKGFNQMNKIACFKPISPPKILKQN